MAIVIVVVMVMAMVMAMVRGNSHSCVSTHRQARQIQRAYGQESTICA